MKLIKFKVIFWFLVLFWGNQIAFGAENIEDNLDKVFVNGPKFLRVDERGFFNVEVSDAIVKWDFNDGNKDIESSVIHGFRKSGEYNIKVNIDYIDKKKKDTVLEYPVFVYNEYIVYGGFEFLDNSLKQEFFNKGKLLLAIEDLINLNDVPDVILISDNVLSSIVLPSDEWKDVPFLVFSDKSISLNTRLISRLQYKYDLSNVMLLSTNFEGFINNFLTKNTSEVINNLGVLVQKFSVLSKENYKIRPWNLLSFSYNILLSKGIPTEILILMLLIPFYVLLFVFSKQVIGFSFAGDISNPLILALIWEVMGLRVGVAFALLVIILGIFFRYIYGRLMIPSPVKSGMFFGSMGVGLFLVLVLVSPIVPDVFIPFSSENPLLSIFPFILFALISERMLYLEQSTSLKYALESYFEVGIISLFAYIFINSNFIKPLFIGFPELVVFVIFFIYLLGRYTGLRLFEIWKFRSIIFNIDKESDEETE